MAKIKAGQLNQILFTMVDRTDFASVESAVTSGFTQRLWGVRHGTSAAAVAKTPSKTISVVRSGVFRATLKASESSDFDLIVYEVEHASCATQIMPFELVFNDDSDMMSNLLLTQSMASDAASAAQQANSRVLLNLSRISDAYSMLSDFYSDFQSRVPKLVATESSLSDVISDLRSLVVAGVGFTVSGMSDVASQVWAHATGVRVDSRVLLIQSQTSDTYSLVSDMNSNFQSRVPKLVASHSQVSDVYNQDVMILDLAFSLVSAVSDVRSKVIAGVPLDASTMSDLRSAIAATTATLSVSDISDIASAVWANTIGARVDSRITLNQSRISDTYSMLSDLYSDFQSRVPKLVATNSQLSDIHSDIVSYLTGMSGMQSDIYSALSDMNSDLRSLIVTTGVNLNASVMSDIRSAVNAVTVNLTASDISDIASAVAAAVTTINASDISDIASAVKAALASDMSDILSAAQQTNSRVLLNQSQISNTYSMLSDFYSDFQSRVPKLVATNSQLSDLISDLQSDIHSFVGAGVSLDASTMSDIRSAISAGGAGTLTISDISDIASAVWANTVGARVDSRVLLNQSGISNIYSLLSDVQSDFQSRVPKRVATDSQLSDLISDIRSYLVNMSGMLSDTHSAVVQTSSRTLAVQSQVSDIYSLLSDVSSDLGVMSGVLSDTYSAISNLASDIDSRFPATIPELTGDPGATPTWAQAEALQFMWLKNNSKTTPTKRMLRNNAGTTVLSATQADDTLSYVQGKLG